MIGFLGRIWHCAWCRRGTFFSSFSWYIYDLCCWCWCYYSSCAGSTNAHFSFLLDKQLVCLSLLFRTLLNTFLSFSFLLIPQHPIFHPPFHSNLTTQFASVGYHSDAHHTQSPPPPPPPLLHSPPHPTYSPPPPPSLPAGSATPAPPLPPRL